LAKIPVPELVHVTPVLLVALAPAVIFTAPEFEQVEIAVPAIATGAALTTTLVDAVAEQEAELVTVTE
jgi:hypothetical protein